ncbi:hypothetical protein FOCC_FOCC012275 [Frankliniella occidentalis]|nr:hypothetical protein FOCC_FOCC012275 [Frankliniella occidentalis]
MEGMHGKHHSFRAEEDKQPTSDSNIPEISAWLQKENIPFEKDMLKAELLALVKMYRKPKKFLIEECIKGTQHEILRLPPYHACFNQIELACGLVKRYFDAHVGRGHDYSEEMMRTIFEEAPATVWNRIGDKIGRRIEEAYDTELQDEDPDHPFQMG